MNEKHSRRLTPEQEELTREELVKDAELRIAQRILDDLGANVSLEWVREADAKDVGHRRVLQING